MSKGSGMIHPNMATMLGYIATDAAIAQPMLQQMVSEAANRSFNCITVDGDTSTNDALMLIATGASSVQVNDSNRAAMQAVVTEVATVLAQAIVRDGEGATKFMTIKVEGGKDEAECRGKRRPCGQLSGRRRCARDEAERHHHPRAAESWRRTGHAVDLRLLLRLCEDQRQLQKLDRESADHAGAQPDVPACPLMSSGCQSV
jgi:hypothetical protein